MAEIISTIYTIRMTAMTLTNQMTATMEQYNTILEDEVIS